MQITALFIKIILNVLLSIFELCLEGNSFGLPIQTLENAEGNRKMWACPKYLDENDDAEEAKVNSELSFRRLSRPRQPMISPRMLRHESNLRQN